MPNQIYARFSDVDQAEAAIRALRHHCGGIHAFQIRRRPRVKDGESDILPTAAFALYNNGAFVDGATGMGMGMGMMTGPVPAAFWDENTINRVADGGLDGPAGREDCLLAVTIDEQDAAHAETILRAQHGLEIFKTDN